MRAIVDTYLSLAGIAAFAILFGTVAVTLLALLDRR